MLKEILENMTIYIEDESIDCWNQASSNKDVWFSRIYLEFVPWRNWRGMVDVFYNTEETKEQPVVSQSFFGKIITYVQELALFTWRSIVYMETGSSVWKGRWIQETST